jgi:hypothetical protein
MFISGYYRIVETKEEYLKDYSESWNRYDGGLPPFSISEIDTITFPIGLHYSASDDGHFCGSWWMYPAEEIKEKIIQSHREVIECYTQRIKRLENFFAKNN